MARRGGDGRAGGGTVIIVADVGRAENELPAGIVVAAAAVAAAVAAAASATAAMVAAAAVPPLAESGSAVALPTLR